MASSQLLASANRGDALAKVRNLFPGPDKCLPGVTLPTYAGNGKWNYNAPCVNPCAYIIDAVKSMQATIDDWHRLRNELNYVDAYTVVMEEYNNYFSNNCIVANTGGTVTDNANTGTPKTGDAPTGEDVVIHAPAETDTASKVVETVKSNKDKIILYGGIFLALVVVIIIIKKVSK